MFLQQLLLLLHCCTTTCSYYENNWYVTNPSFFENLDTRTSLIEGWEQWKTDVGPVQWKAFAYDYNYSCPQYLCFLECWHVASVCAPKYCTTQSRIQKSTSYVFWFYSVVTNTVTWSNLENPLFSIRLTIYHLGKSGKILSTQIETRPWSQHQSNTRAMLLVALPTG